MKKTDSDPTVDSFIKNFADFSHGDKDAGARMADSIVKILGSWKFIVTQTIVLTLWALLNMFAWFEHWDPYPFILLNLFLSLQAAYAAPIIMMSQNRQHARDQIEVHRNFLINQKAEREIHYLMRQLASQDKKIDALHKIIIDLQEALGLHKHQQNSRKNAKELSAQ